MTRLDAARQAIHLQNPPYIPMVRYEKLERADVLKIHVSDNGVDDDHRVSEWGFEWEKKKNSELDFSQVKRHPIPDWSLLADYCPAPIGADTHRFDRARALMRDYPDRYYLADFRLSGFTVLTMLRGFENLMMDFYLEEENLEALADLVFGREEDLIRACAGEGFHGICLMDDMGTQRGLIFSREIFRKYFKPRFRRQFDLAHSLGMDVYMHSCGYVFDLVGEYADIGLDIMNYGQPALNDIRRTAQEFGDDLCFSLPVGYQTTAVYGTLQDVENELLEYIDCFAKRRGGYLALVLRGYASIFGAEKEQKIIEIYDRHCGRDSVPEGEGA